MEFFLNSGEQWVREPRKCRGLREHTLDGRDYTVYL